VNEGCPVALILVAWASNVHSHTRHGRNTKTSGPNADLYLATVLQIRRRIFDWICLQHVASVLRS